jgi:tetratricopeptide (TPR) repeat protein
VQVPPAAPKVAAAPPKPPVLSPVAKPAAAAASPGVLGNLISDLETSLGDDFLNDAASAPVAPPKSAPVAAASAPVVPVPAAKGPELGALVADLETSLGDFPQAPAVVASAPVAAPRASAAAASAMPVAAAPPAPVAQAPVAVPAAPLDPAAIDLSGMFSDLRNELEEDVAKSDEDPETHYNLGVAFREMGLLDEAIGELQKVCQAVERGHNFPQLMQTYTWLAQCFLDKGVPEAAIRWYQQALKIPNLEGESSTALHYELGSAFELAQNKPEALKHFLQVYGSNIDYRDVAERIKALKS